MDQNIKLENTKPSIMKVIFIPFSVAIVMAIFELAPAARMYEKDMSIADFLANTSSGIPYYLALILVLVSMFPVAYCIFKEKGIKLGACIINKEKLLGDILFGILAAVLSFGLYFVVTNVILGYPIWRPAFDGIWILSFISLVLVSGFFKEIYFRGLANHFLKENLGEWQAFLIVNLLFAVLDWPNLGMSFLYGLIWIAFYRKRNRMIVPIIAHAVHNLLSMSIGFLIIS